MKFPVLALVLAATVLLPCAALPAELLKDIFHEIGLPGRPFNAYVTPQATLNTGCSEAVFMTGLEASPLDSMAWEPCLDGSAIVRGRLVREGMEYRAEFFCAPLAHGVACPPEVAVARMHLRNLGNAPRQARFWVGVRAPNAVPGRLLLDAFYQSLSWKYNFRGNVAERELMVIGVYPQGYAERYAYAGHVYDGRFGYNPSEVEPMAIGLMARYDLSISAGRDTVLTFYFPTEPAPPSYTGLINALNSDSVLTAARNFWGNQLAVLSGTRFGDSRVDAFVRAQMRILLQQGNAYSGLMRISAAKNRRIPLEILDAEEMLRPVRHLGMNALESSAIDALKAQLHADLIQFSAAHVRAPTAGLLGLEASLGMLEKGFHPAEDTLRMRADSVAAWWSPGESREPNYLELATGAWGLESYAKWLAAGGRSAEAATRRAQARGARGQLEARFARLGPDLLLTGGPSFLPWLSEDGNISDRTALLLKPSMGWGVRKGLVNVGDSALVGKTLDWAQSLHATSMEGTGALLALVTHASTQGAFGEGFNMATRTAGATGPPSALLGARAADEWIGRMVTDSSDCLLLGRGLPALAPGESLSLGPIATPLGEIRVQAASVEGALRWTWQVSPGFTARHILLYVPVGCQGRGGDGDEVLGGFGRLLAVPAGRGEVRYRFNPGSSNLRDWLDRLTPRP